MPASREWRCRMITNPWIIAALAIAAVCAVWWWIEVGSARMHMREAMLQAARELEPRPKPRPHLTWLPITKQWFIVGGGIEATGPTAEAAYKRWLFCFNNPFLGPDPERRKRTGGQVPPKPMPDRLQSREPPAPPPPPSPRSPLPPFNKVPPPPPMRSTNPFPQPDPERRTGK